MNNYRKIKIFRFSEFDHYTLCQESANDYYSELAKQDVDCDVVMNNDYIAVLLPKVSGLFKGKAGKIQIKELENNGK